MSGTNPGTATPSGAAWVQPQPQAVLGLSSSVIYGDAFTSSFPLSFQLATGGLFKLVIDPVGYAGAFPETMASAGAGQFVNLFGSGVGGNVQVTLGTAANVHMGVSYNIRIGDEIKLKTGQHPAMRKIAFITGAIMAAASIAFQIVYGLMKHDDSRATFVVAYQILIQATLAVLLGAECGYWAVDHHVSHSLFDIFGECKVDDDPETGLTVYQHILKTLLSAAVAPGAILPPILESVGEKHLEENLTEDASVKGATQGSPGDGSYVKAQ